MNSHHSRPYRRNLLVTIVLAVSATACSLPNAPATKAAAAMSQPFSSGEILQVIHTVNNAEIKQAGLALQRSDSPMVQEVAQMIIQDHRVSNERLASIAQTTDAKLDESLLSKGLRTQSNEIIENLAKLSGRELDCTYLQKQVEQHALTLKTVRDQLLPSAKQPQVKELLTAATPKLEAHMKAARANHAQMQCPQT